MNRYDPAGYHQDSCYASTAGSRPAHHCLIQVEVLEISCTW